MSTQPGLGRAVLELSTDDTKLDAGLDRAKGSTKGLEGNFKSAGESAKAFSAALSNVFGEQLEQRARAIATGILQVGGATKLTDAEAKTHLATLNAWIEKAGRLGKEVPAHILSTRDALKNLEPPLTLAQKAAGLLTSTFGQFTLAGLASQAIGKLGAGVSEFISIGLKLPAVEQSYRRLTTSMRVDGQAMLANMTASTRGMVANYDLMTSANKAMLLGLPVTAASMGELARTATILGKAMGQDATKSIDDLITALGRSSPPILDNLGLTVKVGEANEAYAAKMKIVGRELTEAEKKTAFYEAAMVAAKKKTAELGDQAMTLGEVLTSVWTQIGNVVTSATATINVGIGSVVSSGKGFATFLEELVRHGSGGAVAMAALREEMIAMARARKAAMGKDVNLTSPESEFAKLQVEARKLATTVVPLTAAQRDLALAFERGGLSVQQITEKMAPLGVSMRAVQNAIDANKKSTTEAASAAKRYADLVAEVTQANQPLTLAQIAQVRSLEALGVGHGKIADFLRVTEAQVSRYTDSLKEQAKALAEIGKQIDKIPHNVKLRLESTNLSGFAPMIDVKAVQEASGAVKRISDATFGDIEGRMKAMGVLTSAELGRLAVAARERFESMRASGKFTADELAAAWKKAQAATDAAIGKTSGLFGSLMADLGKIPGMIVAAFQGGGGGEGAAKSVGSMLGSTLGSHLGDSLKKNGGKFFQSALGDVFTQALPAIGALLGPLAGAIWGKLFGTAGRDTKLQMAKDAFGSVEEMQKQLVTLGQTEYDRLWKQFSQVGQNNKGQAVAAIEAITAALEAQKQRTAEAAQAAVDASLVQQEALDGITAKYADTIAKIDSEYKSLSDSVAQEAAEDVMGLVETQQRARMQQLEDEKKALEQQRDAEIAAKRETFSTVLEAGQRVDVELRRLFGKPMEIPVIFATPAGGYSVSAPTPFLPGGSGASSFAGASSSRAAVIENRIILDGREIARNQMRHLPTTLQPPGVPR